MIVCISGATGFIGGKLAEHHLRLGDDVRYLTRKNNKPIGGARAFLGDVSSSGGELNMFLENADVFYHCAGELKNEAIMHKTHVQGALNLLRAMQHAHSKKNKKMHWIQLSSCGAYGQQASTTKRYVNENSLEQPSGKYECTKTEADNLIVAYAKKNNWFKYTIIRPTIVFGIGMKSKAIVRLANLVKVKLFFYVGTKNAIANYMHVDDVVNAMSISANQLNAYNQVFIVSNDCKFSDAIDAMADALSVSPPNWIVNERLLRGLVRFVGRYVKLPIRKSQIDVMTRQTYYSNEKIKERLQWSPSESVLISLKQYVRTMINLSK